MKDLVGFLGFITKDEIYQNMTQMIAGRQGLNIPLRGVLFEARLSALGENLKMMLPKSATLVAIMTIFAPATSVAIEKETAQSLAQIQIHVTGMVNSHHASIARKQTIL